MKKKHTCVLYTATQIAPQMKVQNNTIMEEKY